MRTKEQIVAELKAEGILRDNYNNLNEGAPDGYNPHEDRLTHLSEELIRIEKEQSPLTSDLAGERAWFNAQGFTGAELQRANTACLERGYSLSELQAAVKASS